jgi:uracil-DNA glycosylase family 4
MWLEGELAAIKPRVLVALGAVPAASLLGSTVRVTRDRSRLIPSSLAEMVTVTLHPSSILRAPDPEARREAMRRFVADLRKVARALKRSA